MTAVATLLPNDNILKARVDSFEQYQKQRGSWEGASAWSGSLARHLVEDVHEHFRRSFSQVLEMVEEREKAGEAILVSPEVVNALRWRLRGLLNHHNGEDHHFFPMIRRREPTASDEIDVLERDHQRLHPLEEVVLGTSGDDTTTDADRVAALKEFVSFLGDHLNREEMIVVPILLKHSNRADWW